jgi:hypothetical protein
VITGLQRLTVLEGLPDVAVRLVEEPEPHYVIFREIVKDSRSQ